MTAGVHGTTFGGNPLAMAVGNAVLDVMLEPGFLDAGRADQPAAEAGPCRAADRHPGVIEDIRGDGLLLGLKCRVPNTELAAAAREQKLLTVPAGDNVVRLLPPLTIDETHRRRGLRPARPRLRAGGGSGGEGSGGMTQRHRHFLDLTAVLGPMKSARISGGVGAMKRAPPARRSARPSGRSTARCWR